MRTVSPWNYLLWTTLIPVVIAAGCARDRDTAGAGDAAQQLDVVAANPPRLVIYRAQAGEGELPLVEIRENPPDEPIGVASNAAGEIYVANRNGNVRVYGAGPDKKYGLIRSYEGPHTRLQRPSAIAVNIAGSFYVADLADGHGRVEWFSGGANEDIYPDKVLEGPQTGITIPAGVALDGSGRTFVANQESNQVLVFDPNARDDAAPLAALGGLHTPGHLAVDDLLDIYVVNTADNSIAVFNSTGPQSWTLSRTVSSAALKGASGVAVDGAQAIAVGAIGGVMIFASDAQGGATPIRTLRGAAAMTPTDIWIR
jgi:DNA-binding beta-propeller fold protein YncE